MREARIAVVATRSRPAPMDNLESLEKAVERIHKVGRGRPDLILLPELFANHPDSARQAAEIAQSETGPIAETLAPLARRYGTYIAFGLLRRAGRRLFNSLVLLDRTGKPAWIYDKATPVVTEMRVTGIQPGRRPAPFDCDFGRIAGAICFDVNFLELAERYVRRDVELVLFSSAFPAGRLLDQWCVRYGFSLAGSTWYAHNRVLDCTGQTVAQTSDIIPYTIARLNLNRRVVHMDFNLEKIEKMLDRYRGDVLVDDLRDEAVCVITSLKKGLEVADLIREFRIETLPKYFDRSRRVRREHGGLALLQIQPS